MDELKVLASRCGSLMAELEDEGSIEKRLMMRKVRDDLHLEMLAFGDANGPLAREYCDWKFRSVKRYQLYPV